MKQKEMNAKQQAQQAKQLLIETLTAKFGDKLDQWIKEYAPRKLNVIEVEGKIALLRPIGAKEIASYSMALVDPDKGMDVASRYLLEELWIDGDAELIDDEEYFITVMLQIQNVVQSKTSSFTRL